MLDLPQDLGDHLRARGKKLESEAVEDFGSILRTVTEYGLDAEEDGHAIAPPQIAKGMAAERYRLLSASASAFSEEHDAPPNA